MTTFNRGKLRRDIQKGLIEGKRNYNYTDDYAYDNSVNFGKMDDFLPCRVVGDRGSLDITKGLITFHEWMFSTKSGHCWIDDEGVITFNTMSSESYEMRYIA